MRVGVGADRCAAGAQEWLEAVVAPHSFFAGPQFLGERTSRSVLGVFRLLLRGLAEDLHYLLQSGDRPIPGARRVLLDACQTLGGKSLAPLTDSFAFGTQCEGNVLIHCRPVPSLAHPKQVCGGGGFSVAVRACPTP